jgi:5-methylcytosine-specific restriction protein A
VTGRRPWAGSTRRARLPANWPAIRSAVLERDGWRCQIRGPRCTGRATDADHIEPGDDHRMANLRAACGPCHDRKSGQEGAAARPPLRRPAERHPGLL